MTSAVDDQLASTGSVFAPVIRELPSGYTGLPRQLVEASQRQRLLHGVTVVVAEKGFGAATISDIIDRAGVSKKTFYEHYKDKLACFLAAFDHGSQAMLEAVLGAEADARDSDLSSVDQLRAATRAYLEFLTREDQWARAFCLEVLAAGPDAIARRRACRESFANMLHGWHERGREEHPEWPSATEFAFEGATGLALELTTARIADERADELLALEDELVDLLLAVLRISNTKV